MNQPVRLCWAGWETDTFKLQNAGWQISAEQDFHYNGIRIAINHPKADVQGITLIENFDYREVIDGNNLRHAILPVMLRFEIMGKTIHIKQMNSPDVRFGPIDATPHLMTDYKIHSLEDLAHFQSVGYEKARHEVFLHEANINQILEMALQRQEPEQDRIRKEMLQRKEIDRMKRGRLHTELRLVA